MHPLNVRLLSRALGALALLVSVAHAQTLTWTKRTTGVSADITMNAATYGGGKYVVVGYRGTFVNGGNRIENQVSTSADGATWTARTIVPTNGAIRSLAYGGGGFAAPVEDDKSTNLVLTSPDAVTWTARATGAGNLTSITYGTGFVGNTSTPMWIGVGSANGGNNVVRSTDGVTWTRVNTGRTVDLSQVTYGKNVFLAISRSGTLLYSSNGTTWTVVTVPGLPTGATFDSITHDGAEFLLVVGDSTQRPRLFVSGDGAAWAAGGSALTVNLYNGTIASSGTLAALAGSSGSQNGSLVFTASVVAGFFPTIGAWSAAQNVEPAGFGFNFISFLNGLWIGGGYDASLFTAGAASSGGSDGGSTPPTVTTQPSTQTATAGGAVTFTVAASGTGNTYQWLYNSAAIPGATSASYTIGTVIATNAGSYSVRITNSGGTATSNAATLTVNPAGSAGAYLTNLSIRARAGTGEQTLIVALTVGGAGTSGSKTVLVRGIGPALAGYGLATALADPKLTALAGSTPVGGNDNWVPSEVTTAIAATGAFPLLPGSKDAAFVGSGMTAGSYSILLEGVNGASGVALAEIYDTVPSTSVTAATPRFTNVSSRTFVGTGDEALICGFVVGGTGTRRLLLRAVGPGLAQFDLTGLLADPQLSLYNGNTLVASNDDWDNAAVAQHTSAGAFALPVKSKDAALIATVGPGGYSIVLTGANNGTGIALIELYELP